MNTINILITDDNPEFVKALKFMLEEHFPDKIRKIFTASNGQEAIDILNNQFVDIVFMDIDMPVMNGISATREIVNTFWGIKVIALSFSNDSEKIKDMIYAGARNFLLKEKIEPDILNYCLSSN